MKARPHYAVLIDHVGYDAVHLATAVAWREAVAEAPVLATYDRELWKAAAAQGLEVWPEELW